jgi:hypothetical protein
MTSTQFLKGKSLPICRPAAENRCHRAGVRRRGRAFAEKGDDEPAGWTKSSPATIGTRIFPRRSACLRNCAATYRDFRARRFAVVSRK